MNKNKIDELIEQWGNPQEAHRIYRLVLFDYYLTRCFELTDRKLENVKHYGISEKKAMFNFLFICLNSVEENSYGLFEIFDNFKLVCGWSRRLLVVSHTDIERLFVLIPEHLPNGNKWEKRPLNRRPKIWTALEEKSIADFIHDSSVGKYARMIDRGMDELLEKFPPYCLADLAAKHNGQADWIKWTEHTIPMHLTNNIAVGAARRSYNICKTFSIEMLLEDKKQMLEGI